MIVVMLNFLTPKEVDWDQKIARTPQRAKCPGVAVAMEKSFKIHPLARGFGNKPII
jgi:hypothetical protein